MRALTEGFAARVLLPGAALLALAADSGAQCELGKAKASDGHGGGFVFTDGFGSPLVLEGQRLIAGGYDLDAAYVLEDTPFGWLEVGKLATAPDAADSLALSGALAAVGSTKDDDAGADAGTVRLFELGPLGWVEAQKLFAADASRNDLFGFDVDLAGSSLLVGARFGDGLAADSGAAYVFERGPASWTQVAKLVASDGALGDRFGEVLALAPGIALVGAPGDGDAGTHSGAAYVFEHGPAGWTQAAKLTASDASPVASFGTSVGLEGDQAFLGAPGADAVYVFERSLTGWNEIQRIQAPPGSLSFARSLSVSGDRLLVGTGNKQAHAYGQTPAGWIQSAALSSPEVGGSFGEYLGLGSHVALSGDLAAVDGHLSFELYQVQGSVTLFTLASATCIAPVPVVLSATPLVASPQQGWTQALTLTSGPYYAGDSYLLFGSASGTTPGVDVAQVHLPLNPDAYFLYTLASPNAGLVSGSLGVLDSNGSAQAEFTLPMELGLSLPGLKLDHAALVIRTVGGVSLPMAASKPVALTVTFPGGVALSGTPLILAPPGTWSKTFHLTAGDYYAGDLYLLLGSASGTVPGLSVSTVELPLNPDSYFLYTLANPSSSVLVGSLGVLDSRGNATIGFTLPSATARSLEGVTLDHAGLVLRIAGGAAYAMAASNPLPLTFTTTEPLPHPLLHEDFESGAPTWTLENTLFGLWHLAPSGECGSVTTMAAYNRAPLACDYAGGLFGASFGTLSSAPFLLDGTPPHEVRFTSMCALDPNGNDNVLVRLVDVDTGETLQLAGSAALENDGTLEIKSFSVPDSASWVGRTVELQFSFVAGTPENSALGWLVDDVRVAATAP